VNLLKKRERMRTFSKNALGIIISYYLGLPWSRQ